MATLATGSLADAAFVLVAVINTVVGTVQEVRAKRTLDRLALLNAPTARARRDGEVASLPIEQLVVDDIIEMRTGDQVAADSMVASGRAEVDESLVTGEADPVPKSPGDPLVSGTWLVGGAVVARVTAVGAGSYASRLVSEARRYSLTGSELVRSVNLVLRWLSILMLFIGPILLWRQLQVLDWRAAVRATTAGLVGMVPEGLVLLTTLAFFSAAVRLSRRRSWSRNSRRWNRWPGSTNCAPTRPGRSRRGVSRGVAWCCPRSAPTMGGLSHPKDRSNLPLAL